MTEEGGNNEGAAAVAAVPTDPAVHLLPLPILGHDMVDEDDMVMDKFLEGAAESFLSASTTLSSSEDDFCTDIGGLMHVDSFNVLPSLDMLMMEDGNNCGSSNTTCAAATVLDNPLGLSLKKSDSLMNMISASLLMSPS